MTHDRRCTCGYEATNSEDIADHLAEMFAPDDDRDHDGQVHAEAAAATASADAAGAPPALTCMCGFPAAGIAGMDAHLAAVFTPASRIGRDGARHAPEPAA